MNTTGTYQEQVDHYTHLLKLGTKTARMFRMVHEVLGLAVLAVVFLAVLNLSNLAIGLPLVILTGVLLVLLNATSDLLRNHYKNTNAIANTLQGLVNRGR